MNIPLLEWHVTHSCNFTCQGCGHFTNTGYKEDISIQTLKSWYLLWNKKLRPKQLSMLGGEPLLHKKIVDIIYMTKKVWDIQDDQIFEIVTNGLLFDRVEGLPQALIKTNCILTITKHSDDPNYIRLFTGSIEKIKKSGVNYRISDATNNWIKCYNGYAEKIEPIGSSDYIESWNNCPCGQENFQLYDGKIYKCSALAYLQLQKKVYGDKLSSKWDPYLKYTPLFPTDDELEILEFFTKTAEPVCSMCPQKAEKYKKMSPLHSSNYMRKVYEI
jgi:hypothetical protein